MSQANSLVAINLGWQPLKPESNIVTGLQTKEEKEAWEGEHRTERESKVEKENKLLMLTSNVPQRVVKRKR